MELIAKKIALGFAALFLFAGNVFATDIAKPNGADRTTTVNDFMPHPSLTKEFNETWSYQFVFDNGTRAFVNYSKMYIPGTGPKVGCDLSFWNFKGKSYAVGRQYPPERLVANKSTASIDIKGEYAMEKKPGKGHRVFFSADKGGKFLLDVTFESAENGWVSGDGIWKVGSEKFAQYIHIPYGRVVGRIAHDGDTLKVKGYAYMDQTWQTTQATKITTRSLNFSTNARVPMYAGRLSLTEDGKIMGYVIYRDSTGSKIANPKQIKDNGNIYSGKKFPKGTLSIEWDKGIPNLTFASDKILQKASLLDKVDSWFARQAMKIAAGGEILFYRGRSDGNQGKKIDWAITGVKD